MNVTITVESGATVNIYFPAPPSDPVPDESLAVLQATIDDANAFAKAPTSTKDD